MARDLVCSMVLLAVSGGYYFQASGIGRSALADEVGPNGLPIVYAIVLAVIALLMMLHAFLGWSLRRRSASESTDAPTHDPSRDVPLRFALRRAGGVLAIGIGYLLILTITGYVIALALLLAAMLVYQGERVGPRVALAAVGGAGFFWLLFDRLLGVPMPGLWGL